MRIFFIRKETPTSRLKGVDEGSAPVYLWCLGIETRHVHRQQGLIQKHTIWNFWFITHHPPSRGFFLYLTRVRYQKAKKNINEWIRMNLFKTNTFNALWLIFKNQTSFAYMKVLNKTIKITNENSIGLKIAIIEETWLCLYLLLQKMLLQSWHLLGQGDFNLSACPLE